MDSCVIPLKAMEVDSHKHYGYWGGGYCVDCEECHQESTDVYGFFKGQKGKEKGKNNTWTKGGAQDWTTAQLNGKGQGGRNFNGQCYWCGE